MEQVDVDGMSGGFFFVASVAGAAWVELEGRGKNCAFGGDSDGKVDCGGAEGGCSAVG